jgi:hypothetical protein
MIAIDQDFIIQKFYELGSFVKYNRYNNTYQCSCPICREGNSFGKKQRCYYIPAKDNIFCHNCGWSSKPFTWIKEVSGQTDYELLNEIKTSERVIQTVDDLLKPVTVLKQTPSLPHNSINLFDPSQVTFYKDNNIVKQCLQLIEDRKLNVGINKPKSLYISLTDQTHKNRLIIPFFDEFGDIVFYQSRAVTDFDKRTTPKYTSKINAVKSLFNIDKVIGEIENVFIFEGPINAFFTKNSVAVAGITEKGQVLFTEKQQQQVNTVLKWHTRVWVLDSQWLDNASLKKTEILLNLGEKVYIWPENFGRKFKDFNDICISLNVNELTPEFIQKNTFEGLEGILRLSEIKRFRHS